MQLLPDVGQSVKGFVQCLFPFGKVEAYKVVHVLPEETGTRYSAHTDQSGKILSEPEVAVVAEGRHIHKHVICSLGDGVTAPDSVQSLEKQISFCSICCPEAIVIGIRELQGRDNRLL